MTSLPSSAETRSRNQCWFCGESIERSDQGALEIDIRNLWIEASTQTVFSHSQCAQQRLQGKGRQLYFDAINGLE
jgi:hypothetical protein